MGLLFLKSERVSGPQAAKQLCRKGTEGLVDTSVNMRQQCALLSREADIMLGCISRTVARMSGEVILPLFSAWVRTYLM